MFFFVCDSNALCNCFINSHFSKIVTINVRLYVVLICLFIFGISVCFTNEVPHGFHSNLELVKRLCARACVCVCLSVCGNYARSLVSMCGSSRILRSARMCCTNWPNVWPSELLHWGPHVRGRGEIFLMNHRYIHNASMTFIK